MPSGQLTAYRIFDASIASSIPLEGLRPAPDLVAPDIFFTVCHSRPQTETANWFHEWTVAGRDGADALWLKLGTALDGHLLRFPNLADFRLTDNSCGIECFPAGEIPASTLQHLLLDQVLPLVFSMRGRCILHASAVVICEGEAIAFAAPSGFGKSTLATALARSGRPLLTDDGLLIQAKNDQVTCVASYPGVRLWKDSSDHLFGPQAESTECAHYTAKKRLVLHSQPITLHEGQATLRRLYILGPGSEADGVSITPLAPRDAFMELVRYTFQMDVRNPGALKSAFEQLSQLAPLNLFYRLNYPRDWGLLPSVVDAVLAHAADRGKDHAVSLAVAASPA